MSFNSLHTPYSTSVIQRLILNTNRSRLRIISSHIAASVRMILVIYAQITGIVLDADIGTIGGKKNTGSISFNSSAQIVIIIFRYLIPTIENVLSSFNSRFKCSSS